MTRKQLYTDKEQILDSNRRYFESCIQIAQKLFREKLYEDCINYIEKTASFGWFNFSGYYKSEDLELLLLKVQQKILPPLSHQKKGKKTNKVLHICSEVYTSGGHSKLMYNWIKNDPSKNHSILSTRLTVEEVKVISEFYLQNTTDLQQISIKSSSKIESVNLLNQQPLNDYDVILLHIHPDETITNIVLSQEDITTPVCFINHADHVFWLGTSISDFVLQIRESNIPIDVERRGISEERQFFLPIPVENSTDLNDENTSDSTNILSTGTAYKYNPNEKYNFLREAYKTVEENPEAVFHIVGINSDSVYAQEYKHPRIILHGIISFLELAELEKKSHIYVEGFPMASFTALLQAALRRMPFVLHYNPLPLFKLFGDDPKNAIIYPENLEEWHNNINKLIRDKNYRKKVTQKQYEYILNNFSIEVWKSRVAKLYETTDKKSHSFWKPTPDKYYHDENEKLLVTIDKKRFAHYQFTENLSLRRKFFVYLRSRIRNMNITYFNKRELLKYFLNR